jgi:hypothetical protein
MYDADMHPLTACSNTFSKVPIFGSTEHFCCVADMNHWALVILSSGRKIEVFDEEIVIGAPLIPGICTQHLVLRRLADGCEVSLWCETGGAKLDGEELEFGKKVKWVGGWIKLREADFVEKMNVSVLTDLPREDFSWDKVLGVGSQAEVKLCTYKVCEQKNPFALF